MEQLSLFLSCGGASGYCCFLLQRSQPQQILLVVSRRARPLYGCRECRGLRGPSDWGGKEEEGLTCDHRSSGAERIDAGIFLHMKIHAPAGGSQGRERLIVDNDMFEF